MERLHAVVLPTDATGHINPMWEFSHRLAPLGFTISFIVSEKTCGEMKTMSKEEHIQLVPFKEGDLGNYASVTNYHNLLEPMEQLIKGLQQPVSCLISDNFMGWTQDVANSLGIPRIAFWTASSFGDVICFNIPLLISTGYVPINANLNDESLITFLPGVAPLHRTQLPLAFYQAGPVMDALAKALQRVTEALCTLVNTIEELEEKVVSARRTSFRYFPVGPLVSPAFLKDDGDAPDLSEHDLICLRWLDKQAPFSVLYIAFGSTASLPAEQVEKIALSLEASKQPFLWAIRRNFALDTPESFYDGLQGRFGAQGLVVEWAPQLHVLRHSSVGGFFTHCGWNSTMEAVCSGVPTLCWPCEAEQNLNSSNMVDNWKIGMKVTEGRNGDVQVEELVRLITALMGGEEGKEMRSRIEGLKEIARGTFKEGGSSEKNLCELKNLIVAAPKSGQS